MSATDPSAPGLPLAGGGGGGASIPVTTMSALLVGATASQMAATDSGGTGTLLNAAQSRALILAFGGDANGDVMVRAGGVWTRLGVGSDGYVFTVVGGAPAWAASSGVSLSAANVFTAIQTFSVVDSGNSVLAVANFRHTNNSIGSFVGTAAVFEIQQNSDPPIELGRVRGRYLGGDSAMELVPYRGGGTAPTVGVRARATVDAAVNGVEVLVAAGTDAPTIQPYIAVGAADLDLNIAGQGTGVLRLKRPAFPTGTVAAINGGSGVFASPVAGQAAFATDAAGGAKPCWYDGAGWILASGVALT